jgi:hypothetical protein
MTDEIADAALDERLRTIDPLGPESLPSEAETETALRRLLATGPDARRRRRGMPGWRARLTRPRLLAGTTAGAVVVATALALLLSATTSPEAFAVTRNANGTITVKLIRLSGIPAANTKLAAMGLSAKIVALQNAKYMARLKPCQGPPAGTVRTVTFDPATIPRRKVLLLTADHAAHLGFYSASVKPGAVAMPALPKERALIKSAQALAKHPPALIKRGQVLIQRGQVLIKRGQVLIKRGQPPVASLLPAAGSLPAPAAVARARAVKPDNKALPRRVVRVFCGRTVAAPPPATVVRPAARRGG